MGRYKQKLWHFTAGARTNLRAFPGLCGCLALAACGTLPPINVQIGSAGPPPLPAGLIAADEPQAALVARDILQAKGTAADAGAALAFVLAVTLPSDAGLGGGGACIVHDAAAGATEVLDFLSRDGMPMLARGLQALHAKYGVLPWAQIVAPAERRARFGFPVSRALALKLADGTPLGDDARTLKAFMNPQRLIVQAGEKLQQPDLAVTLATIRSGTLPGAAAPQWVTPGAADMGSARVFSLSQEGDATAGTSFVVADTNGNAVACVLTVGRTFGTRRMTDAGYLQSAAAVPHAAAAIAIARARVTAAVAGDDPAMLSAHLRAVLTEGKMPADIDAEVNMLVCRAGADDAPPTCHAHTAPHGAGYAIVMGKE